MLQRGKIARDRNILGVRVLSRDDLALLKDKRHNAAPPVQRLRDPHHLLARLLASGLRLQAAAAKSGYSYNRAFTLSQDPSFKNLIAEYRAIVTEKWANEVDTFFETATSNMLKAERQIADKLEEAEENNETLPTKDLLAISRDAADRLGYGKKQTNVNVNVDFASALERAIRRSATVLEGQVLPNPPSVGQPRPPAMAAPQPFRRRA